MGQVPVSESKRSSLYPLVARLSPYITLAHWPIGTPGFIACLKAQAFLYLNFELSGEVPHCRLFPYLFSPRPFPSLL